MTEGKPTVTDVVPSGSFTEAELLRRLASAERASEHPLGAAIVQAAIERELSIAPVSDFQAIVGHGLEAVVDGHRILAGNAKLLRDRGLNPDVAQAQAMSDVGKTLIFVAADGTFAGFVAVADRVKKSSSGPPQAVAQSNQFRSF